MIVFHCSTQSSDCLHAHTYPWIIDASCILHLVTARKKAAFSIAAAFPYKVQSQM